MIVTPYYNKPTQAGILTHFRLVADATDLPVILYDIPGRTGVEIKYETILRLAKHPNILAVKDAKGDFSEVSRVLNQTDLMYFSGDDANVLPHLSIGAAWLIGVTANIAAAPYRTIVDAVNRATSPRPPPSTSPRTARPRGDDARAGDGRGEVHPPRPRPHRQSPRPPAPGGSGGVGAATIEDELALVRDVPGADFSNFRPDATLRPVVPCPRCTAPRDKHRRPPNRGQGRHTKGCRRAASEEAPYAHDRLRSPHPRTGNPACRPARRPRRGRSQHDVFEFEGSCSSSTAACCSPRSTSRAST